MTSYKFGKTNSYEKKDKVYFVIFYDEKENAKKLGYKWDADKKCWYKYLIYNKNLELHYDIHKYNNEPSIYAKYDELISLYDKAPTLEDVKDVKDILYSA